MSPERIDILAPTGKWKKCTVQNAYCSFIHLLIWDVDAIRFLLIKTVLIGFPFDDIQQMCNTTKGKVVDNCWIRNYLNRKEKTKQQQKFDLKDHACVHTTNLKYLLNPSSKAKSIRLSIQKWFNFFVFFFFCW